MIIFVKSDESNVLKVKLPSFHDQQNNLPTYGRMNSVVINIVKKFVHQIDHYKLVINHIINLFRV